MPKDSRSSVKSKHRMDPCYERVNSAKRQRRHRANLQIISRRKAVKESVAGSSQGSLFEASRNVEIGGGQFSSAQGHHANFTINFNQSPMNDGMEEDDITYPGNTNDSELDPVMDNEGDSRPIWGPPPLPVQRSCDIYYRHLAVKGRGSPIWLPEPSSTLPNVYRRGGITVGDVGIITASGAFDFMFNICLPADHPINQEGLPEGFSPLFPQLRSSDIHRHTEFNPNSHLASASVEKSHRENDNSGIAFESSASEGAILTMPQGAHAEDLANVWRFRRYLSANMESWYRYVNNIRGREARNGDVRLVVGCDKASSWGMATFANSTAQDFHLKFKPTGESGSRPNYEWEYSGMVEARAGPIPEEMEELRSSDDSGYSGVYKNPCLFVRTLNATLRDDLWQGMAFDFETAMDVQYDSYPNSYIPHSGSGPSTRSPSPTSPSYSNSTIRAGSTRAPGMTTLQQKPLPTVLVADFNTALTAHPAKTMNDFLLRANPHARIAMTEDKDWTSLLVESDQRLPNPEELINRMLTIHDVCEADGVVFLQLKQEKTPTNNLSKALSQSHGAMHGSANLDPPLRCHPTKREKVTEDIVDRIEDTINLTQAKLRRSLVSEENLEDPDGKIGPDQKDGNKSKLSRSCTRCKNLKVRCEAKTETEPCRRCVSAGHECVVARRKIRRTPISSVQNDFGLNEDLPSSFNDEAGCFKPSPRPQRMGFGSSQLKPTRKLVRFSPFLPYSLLDFPISTSDPGWCRNTEKPEDPIFPSVSVSNWHYSGLQRLHTRAPQLPNDPQSRGIEHGIERLMALQRDMKNVRNALKETFGFRVGGVITLDDNAAEVEAGLSLRPTRENIVHIIQEFINRGEDNVDYVFFYSGHSSHHNERYSDSPVEEDGLQEFLLCVDANKDNQEYLPEWVINDTYLYDNILVPLEQMKGRTRHLFALFDSCHSSTSLNLSHYRCNKVGTVTSSGSSTWLNAYRPEGNLSILSSNHSSIGNIKGHKERWQELSRRCDDLLAILQGYATTLELKIQEETDRIIARVDHMFKEYGSWNQVKTFLRQQEIHSELSSLQSDAETIITTVSISSHHLPSLPLRCPFIPNEADHHTSPLPSLTPPHPALAASQTPPLNLDMSNPTATITPRTSLPSEIWHQAATRPAVGSAVGSIDIICPRLPWRIKLYPRKNSSFVTVADVFDGLYRALRYPVTAGEFELLSCERARQAVSDALIQLKELRTSLSLLTPNSLDTLGPEQGDIRGYFHNLEATLDDLDLLDSQRLGDYGEETWRTLNPAGQPTLGDDIYDPIEGTADVQPHLPILYRFSYSPKTPTCSTKHCTAADSQKIFDNPGIPVSKEPSGRSMNDCSEP